MWIDNKLYAAAKRLTKGIQDNYIDINDLQEINGKKPFETVEQRTQKMV